MRIRRRAVAGLRWREIRNAKPAMAAVFCFVFLFGLASVALLASSFASSVTAVFAFLTFFALTAGVFVGLFNMTKSWEAEAGPEH